jgi:(p)ppGpp synthase/HD superfamily hydrolase
VTQTVASLEGRKQMGAGKLTARYDEALAYASAHHRKQFRKGSNVPYLSHLMSVSALVLEHGGTENQAIAGLLHDAVEDAAVGQGRAVLQHIGETWDEQVAAMVEACSDSLNDTAEGKLPWEDRKRAYVAALRDPNKKSDEAVLVTAADKTHNARCIADDLRRYGPDFWSTFNAGPKRLLWYYDEVAAAVAERLPGHSVTAVLQHAVADLHDASAG